ncbi:MAG: tRNA (adenosine(37)-N6)-dimethylallyltransferase MiaA [Candidatus Omnitrophica bacterium]|nr:tRNA (adenosine(37)-N6)-dimethylallyltransferase MiaA [Candidatus Omnitrophota bacterium]
MKQKVVFIVGPTAVGKSATAVCLAKKINAEIISCDSMQVYQGMEIISSKPSQGLLKKVPHHLIAAIAPEKEYDASKYYKEADKLIAGIVKKKKTPIFVGGTGLYMSVVVDGIFKMKPPKKSIRENLFKLAQEKGNAYLYDRLKEVDKISAEKIHLNDLKRVVRALEVFEATGKPISELQKERVGLTDKYDVRIFCLDMQRDKLYQRIEERVDKMFEQGLVNEVKKLLKKKLSKTASYAIGIKEIKGSLDGLYDLEEAKKLMKQNTRNYAKRQLTWFRKDKRINWVKVESKDKPAGTAKKISNLLRS